MVVTLCCCIDNFDCRPLIVRQEILPYTHAMPHLLACLPPRGRHTPSHQSGLSVRTFGLSVGTLGLSILLGIGTQSWDLRSNLRVCRFSSLGSYPSVITGILSSIIGFSWNTCTSWVIFKYNSQDFILIYRIFQDHLHILGHNYRMSLNISQGFFT